MEAISMNEAYRKAILNHYNNTINHINHKDVWVV